MCDVPMKYGEPTKETFSNFKLALRNNMRILRIIFVPTCDAIGRLSIFTSTVRNYDGRQMPDGGLIFLGRYNSIYELNVLLLEVATLCKECIMEFLDNS